MAVTYIKSEVHGAARAQQAAVKPVEGAAHMETAIDRGTVPEALPAEAQTAVTPSEGPASPAQVCSSADLSLACSDEQSAAYSPPRSAMS